MDRVDQLISFIEEVLKEGKIIGPAEWYDIAVKLNVLIGAENDMYAKLYRDAHKIQYDAISEGKSASEAEAKMKSDDVYEKLLKQKGKVEQVQEFIRLSKIRMRSAEEEYKEAGL